MKLIAKHTYAQKHFKYLCTVVVVVAVLSLVEVVRSSRNSSRVSCGGFCKSTVSYLLLRSQKNSYYHDVLIIIIFFI